MEVFVDGDALVCAVGLPKLEWEDDVFALTMPVDPERLEQDQRVRDLVSRMETRLGTQEWTRARARARVAVEPVAADLVRLYAARQLLRGHAFAADDEWQRELAAAFPYEETPDQRLAIEAVKADMEAPRPMDRVICGDVGFGKTEVAVRAAFKAVQDGHQVALLVPTTVLAQLVSKRSIEASRRSSTSTWLVTSATLDRGIS